MQQDDSHLIGKTLAEILAIRSSESHDDHIPETDWDPAVQAAKEQQAASDAEFAKNPSSTIPAADGLAVVIARLEVLGRKAGAH